MAWALAGVVLAGCAACGKSEPSAATQPPEAKVVLSQSYAKGFGDRNAVTDPRFRFAYPDDWTVTHEDVTSETEQVTLANDRGGEVERIPRILILGTALRA